MRHPSRASLEGLLEKYVEMLRMRREDAAGLAGDPKREMRGLAARFPGSLREIDRLPLEVIEERVTALEGALRGELEPPAWARYAADYHGWLRAALRIKRMCLACATPEEAMACVRDGYLPEHDEPRIDALGEAGIAAIVRPDDGRLNPWVLARVAALHDVTVEELTRAMFSGS